MDPQNPPQHPHYADDEIDLFELFESLWKERVLIVAITFVITLLGGAYAFLSKPSYEATMAVYETAPESRQLLSGLRFSDVKNINVDEFIAFLKSFDNLKVLAQTETWKDAISGENLSEAESVRELISRELFSVNKVRDKKNQDSYQVWQLTWLARSEDVAERELNDFVLKMYQAFSEFKLDQYENLRSNELSVLNARYDSIYQERERVRVDKLAQLEEALAVATKLNIVEPADLALMAKLSSRTASSSVELINSSDKNPLYLRGSKLLSAEIDVLKSRKNEEPFSEELQKLRASINLLKAEVYPTSIDYGFIKEPAVGNPKRIKPKRLLIVALSGVVGGMFALMYVLIRNAARNRKART